MQIESFESQELATKGDRIQVPGSHPAGALAPVEPPPPTPRLFAVFGSEIRKRKRLLGVWLVITAVVAGAVVLKFARPLYRAEGQFSYIPNYRGGPNSLYTPPNIQTATHMLRSPDVLESVRQDHVPDMTKAEFEKAVRVEITKQSEFLDVSFDHPDPEVAAAVAADLQTRGRAHFEDVRKKALADASAQLADDYRHAGEDLEDAKDRLRAATRARGVTDLEAEKKATEQSIVDVGNRLLEAKNLQSNLKKQIVHQEALRDAPPNPAERSVDEGQLSIVQAEMNQLQAELQNESVLDEARKNLAFYEAREAAYRPAYNRGSLAKADYDEVVLNIERNKSIIKRWEEKAKRLADARKRHETLVKQAGTGKIVRREVLTELDRLRRELDAVPETIKTYQTELDAKKARMTEVIALEKELGPLIEEKDIYKRRFQEFAEKRTEGNRKTRDLNGDDLRVVIPPEVPTTPYSSNAPKLALGIAGASALLFLGYIGLFALPQLNSPGGAPLGQPAITRAPRALVALVPFIRNTDKPAGTNGPLPEPPPPAEPPPAPPPEATPELIAPEVEAEPGPPAPAPGPVVEAKTEPVPEAPVEAKIEPAPIEPVQAAVAPGPGRLVEAKIERAPIAQVPEVPLPVGPPLVENVEDFGAPVPEVVVRRPEPRVPSAPTVLSAKREPGPRVVAIPAVKPILPLPPGLAPMTEVKKPAPAVKTNGPVRALAERIVEENVDRGGIVLFAPTLEQLRVTPIIGDLGKILTGRGDRVLVFDARPAAETPAWAGANVPTVAGFLNGQAAGVGACFAPTVLRGVEYSRGDLSGQLDGVMAAHRFRQLVEEMQERYSLVLMVSPPVTLDGSEPELANLAEGMVLVTESTAPSADVHAFIESLTKRVSAPLYGTLTVPRA